LVERFGIQGGYAMTFARPRSFRAISASIVLAASLALAAPARAQTYDPAWPVCLQVVSSLGGSYYQCAYTTMAQCQATASGRAASCLANPYYAGPGGRGARRPRVY
jgi:hypothetical protein